MEKDVQMMESRLVRMEAKIDRMAETLSEIKTLDERIMGLVNRVNRHEYRLDHMEQQVNDDSSRLVELESNHAVISKILWVVVAAVFGVVSELIRTHFMGAN